MGILFVHIFMNYMATISYVESIKPCIYSPVLVLLLMILQQEMGFDVGGSWCTRGASPCNSHTNYNSL